MNTKEFAHLVDGAIEEAKELGIQTDTPEQLARYKEEWSKLPERKNYEYVWRKTGSYCNSGG